MCVQQMQHCAMMNTNGWYIPYHTHTHTHTYTHTSTYTCFHTHTPYTHIHTHTHTHNLNRVTHNDFLLETFMPNRVLHRSATRCSPDTGCSPATLCSSATHFSFAHNRSHVKLNKFQLYKTLKFGVSYIIITSQTSLMQIIN